MNHVGVHILIHVCPLMHINVLRILFSSFKNVKEGCKKLEFYCKDGVRDSKLSLVITYLITQFVRMIHLQVNKIVSD